MGGDSISERQKMFCWAGGGEVVMSSISSPYLFSIPLPPLPPPLPTGQWSFFGPADTRDFWHVITKLAPPTSVGSVMDMESIQTNVGRVCVCVCVCV